jgi:hypothetical protein
LSPAVPVLIRGASCERKKCTYFEIVLTTDIEISGLKIFVIRIQQDIHITS